MLKQNQIVVPNGKERERIDVFLTRFIENITRTKVKEAIEAGNVLVNGKTVKPSYKVYPKDIINLKLSQRKQTDIIAENIPLNIVYEDDCLIIVNKPAGIVTHPAYGNYTGTLVNALLYHCKGKLSTLSNLARAGIVHRLDKDTSGLLVVAKNDSTHAFLAKQFSQHTIDRTYLAIVWGIFKNNRQGIIETNLGRSKSDRKKITVTIDGKHAITEYEVIKEFEYLSLIRLKLRTGRTHQIRVHLHHIGHPVFGDPTYGGRKISYGNGGKKQKEEVGKLLEIVRRQALHAKTLGFVHPQNNKKMSFDSPIPDDMQEALELLSHFLD